MCTNTIVINNINSVYKYKYSELIYVFFYTLKEERSTGRKRICLFGYIDMYTCRIFEKLYNQVN